MSDRGEEVNLLNSKVKILEDEQNNRKMLISTAEKQLEQLNSQLFETIRQLRDAEVFCSEYRIAISIFVYFTKIFIRHSDIKE